MIAISRDQFFMSLETVCAVLVSELVQDPDPGMC